ncbi:MAG: PAS domain-containing protein, partial [Solirubrobacterales bacterium]
MEQSSTRGGSWPEKRVTEFLNQISAGGEDYRRLVERLPAIVYASELGENGRWRYVSPQVEEILGYTPEEWLADPELWAKLLHPEDRERALSQETRKTIGNRNPPPVDYRMITRDGRTVWILDEAVLEPDETGTPVWHGVLYDITERKNAEQELQRAAAQQAAVAQLGGRALKDGDPELLMREATALMTEIEGVDAACIWEIGRDGRRLGLRAGLEELVVGSERASA